MPRRLHIETERFALAKAFVISRGAKLWADVVVVTLEEGGFRGRGECVPYPRYGETPAGVTAAIESVRAALEAGCDRADLQRLLPPGAARNAVDCALWDLEAKQSGLRAWQIAGLHRLVPVVTAYTISVASPPEMAAAAAAQAHRPLLKIKLAGEDDEARIAAVRAAAPACDLIVDANEAWPERDLDRLFGACEQAQVLMVEQPLPAAADHALGRRRWPVPVCADESVHDRQGLEALRQRYDAINVKLDKAGGLSEAFALVEAAQKLGFAIMVGSMVSSSLAMAPALLLAPQARFVDLDGPLLLAQDRSPGLIIEGSVIQAPDAALWG